jgi:hypothetical protein
MEIAALPGGFRASPSDEQPAGSAKRFVALRVGLPSDRSAFLVKDAQDQEFVGMTLVVDPEWWHAPAPDDLT